MHPGYLPYFHQLLVWSFLLPSSDRSLSMYHSDDSFLDRDRGILTQTGKPEVNKRKKTKKDEIDDIFGF